VSQHAATGVLLLERDLDEIRNAIGVDRPGGVDLDDRSEAEWLLELREGLDRDRAPDMHLVVIGSGPTLVVPPESEFGRHPAVHLDWASTQLGDSLTQVGDWTTAVPDAADLADRTRLVADVTGLDAARVAAWCVARGVESGLWAADRGWWTGFRGAGGDLARAAAWARATSQLGS
jgi:hypothetical protein